jgi:class 3 adenylate cyclase
MFCDLVGSTALSARLDPEDLREVIGAYHRCVADTVGRYRPVRAGVWRPLMARFPRSFVLNYRISGRDRRYTIGSYPTSLWATANERTFLAWVRTVAIVFPLQRRTCQSRPTCSVTAARPRLLLPNARTLSVTSSVHERGSNAIAERKRRPGRPLG